MKTKIIQFCFIFSLWIWTHGSAVLATEIPEVDISPTATTVTVSGANVTAPWYDLFTNTSSESTLSWPQIETVTAIDNQSVQVIFNEGIDLSTTTAETAFTITAYADSNEYLNVINLDYDVTDAEFKTVLVTTAEQEEGKNYIITAGVSITNLAGDPVISGVYDTGFFEGSGIVVSEETILTASTVTTETGSLTTEEADLTPPENITDLMITQKLLELNEYLVTLTWTPSINSTGDLLDQILYKSLNRGQTYNAGTSLWPNATKYETKLEGGKEYTFKITAKDRSGNENTGVIKSIRLPQTGPEFILFITLSGLGASILRRKKK